ncbi:MAG: YajQ family cyclic di-GMP-binding protein [Dehalococcoidia bacterium]|nr:YajQ family cyclic di-GMP-binding protein [Dehalococcoidia bacterium]
MTVSFDVSTGADLQEVDNAVNQAIREITNRFDFKHVVAEINFDRAAHRITVHTSDDFKVEAIWQVLQQRFRSRGIPLNNVKRGEVEKAAGGTVRQVIDIIQSIDADTARKIVKFLKDGKYKKVQSSIQGDEVRVSGSSRDELQAVIADLRGEDWGMELKFGNYR